MKTRSIAGLMLVVATVGLGIAALNRPSRLWGAALFTGAAAILLGAVVVAVVGRGRRRPFWVGFAIFGWAYLILHYGPWFGSEVGPHTLPTAILEMLYPVVSSVPPALVYGPPAPAPTIPPLTPTYIAPDGTQLSTSLTPVTSSGTFILTPSPPLPSPWVAWTQVGTSQVWTGTNTSPDFYRVGHSLLSLLAALVGGMIALRVADGDPESRIETAQVRSGG